jgi:hypothetical protein
MGLGSCYSSLPAKSLALCRLLKGIEEFFCVERRHAAKTCGGNCLTIYLISDIACSEDPGNAR